jgi:hypothetical protein
VSIDTNEPFNTGREAETEMRVERVSKEPSRGMYMSCD